MVNLPVLHSIEIDGYGLFPHFPQSPVSFDAPLTLVLGANGIGKTTLVSLLFRMLTGPFDIPAARGRSLTRGNLEERALDRTSKQYFAKRVNAGARLSHATIKFSLGNGGTFSVARRLSDLSLISAQRTLTSQTSDLADEVSLKAAIVAASEVGTYSDWLLLLRYVAFYQEDRQALLWDEVAQTQILRPLFLSPSDSNAWADQEREIYAIDSRKRNLSASLYATDLYLRREENLRIRSDTLQADLAEVESDLETVRKDLAVVADQLLELAESRNASRLEVAIAEDDLQKVRSHYESAKIARILVSFPDASATSQYILSKLMSEGICLACGQESDQLRQEMEARLTSGKCAVCGRDVMGSSEQSTEGASELITQLEAGVERAEAARQRDYEESVAHRALLTESRDHRTRLAELEQRANELRAQLPRPEDETVKRLEELDVFKQQMALLDAQLLEKREVFSKFVRTKTDEILARAEEIQRKFEKYAGAFLLEENLLTWTRKKAPAGQSGASVPFPHFSLQMGGSDFSGVTARTTADSVSESQREFVDLAFRMALVDLASSNGATMVIDSPDSSLDAVFEPKAASVLSEYVGDGRTKKLIVTSNISSGMFLPDLVKSTRKAAKTEPGVVDLFEMGRATAAVTQLKSEYKRARDSLAKRAKL